MIRRGKFRQILLGSSDFRSLTLTCMVHWFELSTHWKTCVVKSKRFLEMEYIRIRIEKFSNVEISLLSCLMKSIEIKK